MRHIKTLQRIACTLALALVAVLAVSVPKLAFADNIDTSTPGVKVSVFSADGNADTSRVLTDNPQHSGHQTPVPGQYGEIVVRVGQTIRDTGAYSHYTTTRPGFAPFGVPLRWSPQVLILSSLLPTMTLRMLSTETATPLLTTVVSSILSSLVVR